MSVELALAFFSSALCIGSSVGVLVAGVILLFLYGHPLGILCCKTNSGLLVTEAMLQPPGGSQLTGLTFGQVQVKGVRHLLDLAPLFHALQLVPQLTQLDVEVDFILSAWELSAASAGRRHQVESLQEDQGQNSPGAQTAPTNQNSPRRSRGSYEAASQIQASAVSYQRALCRTFHKYLQKKQERFRQCCILILIFLLWKLLTFAIENCNKRLEFLQLLHKNFASFA